MSTCAIFMLGSVADRCAMCGRLESAHTSIKRVFRVSIDRATELERSMGHAASGRDAVPLAIPEAGPGLWFVAALVNGPGGETLCEVAALSTKPPAPERDPFAAWCKRSAWTRRTIISDMRDGGPVDLCAETWGEIADALEAIAAGRRP